MSVKLPRGYQPKESEKFMNSRQKEYFRRKLVSWRAELFQESSETIRHLQEDAIAQPDLADRATVETDRSIELRTRDRERKLIGKIDEALRRLDDGTYGYCEETGEPIGPCDVSRRAPSRRSVSRPRSATKGASWFTPGRLKLRSTSGTRACLPAHETVVRGGAHGVRK